MKCIVLVGGDRASTSGQTKRAVMVRIYQTSLVATQDYNNRYKAMG